VVLVPSNNDAIGLYDPVINNFTAGPSVPLGSGRTGDHGSRYFGGVLLPDGRVVLVPSNAAAIGLYDPDTSTFTAGPNVPTDSSGYHESMYCGGVLLPDGRVVLVPNNAAALGLYDPVNNTFTIGPSVLGYAGGVLLSDGRVVLVPKNAAAIGLYDPATSNFTTGPNGRTPCGTSSNYLGGVLLPDGRVVLVSISDADAIGLYDPTGGLLSGIQARPAYSLAQPPTVTRNALLLPYYNKL
jgi:hypothetical protein